MERSELKEKQGDKTGDKIDDMIEEKVEDKIKDLIEDKIEYTKEDAFIPEIIKDGNRGLKNIVLRARKGNSVSENRLGLNKTAIRTELTRTLLDHRVNKPREGDKIESKINQMIDDKIEEMNEAKTDDKIKVMKEQKLIPEDGQKDMA